MASQTFEQYWETRVKELIENNFPVLWLGLLRDEAELVWNMRRHLVEEEIEEVNVIVNRGIWKSLCEEKKKLQEQVDILTGKTP